jgi:hypothetical protein
MTTTSTNQCTVDNSVEESGIILELLLVEQEHRQVQFHASGPAAFLIFFCTHGFL